MKISAVEIKCFKEYLVSTAFKIRIREKTDEK